MPNDLTLPQDVVELFESGASVVMATRDAKLKPLVGRLTGARVDQRSNPPRITVFLAEAFAKPTVANITDNGQVALAFTHVFSHRSFQAKGKAIKVGPAVESDRERIIRYNAAWAEVLYETGIPRAVTRQNATWPAVAITIEVEQMFVQTPGPKAGIVWKEGAER